MDPAYKILVIGYTGSGKTTVAAILAKLLRGKAEDTSALIMVEYAKDQRMRLADVIAKKQSLRQELFDFGNRRKISDPAYYVRRAIENGATVIAGVRTQIELDAAHELVDWVVWVQRGKRGRTDELNGFDADCMLDNRGNEGPGWYAELQRRCVRLLNEMMPGGIEEN